MKKKAERPERLHPEVAILLGTLACQERAQRVEWSQRDASRTRNRISGRISSIACQNDRCDRLRARL
jgi:hypothetical protein